MTEGTCWKCGGPLPSDHYWGSLGLTNLTFCSRECFESYEPAWNAERFERQREPVLEWSGPGYTAEHGTLTYRVQQTPSGAWWACVRLTRASDCAECLGDAFETADAAKRACEQYARKA